MDSPVGQPQELLRIAAGRRSAGSAEEARAAYVRAYDAARATGDVEAMTQAAVGLAAGQSFGTFPGRVPAFLHEAYVLATGVQRARVAVALARAWVYGGDAGRAVGFATEAVTVADGTGDAALLAEALDAQLLVHWGPDDLAERLRITRRLEDTAVHLVDVEPRLSAHLWRLTTAVECLDSPGVLRQLRALDALAEESGSPRVRFFAAARRGMHALVTGDLAAAAQARDVAVAAGAEAGEGDAYAIERTLSSGIARQVGDRSALVHEAELYEAYGTGEGIVSIAAEGAVLWLAAGEDDRAAALLRRLAGADLGAVPRDVDWLLTVTSLAEVAAGTGATDLAEAAVGLLAPYAGRGVVNAGAAAFIGVVDDYLYLASLALGRTTDADRFRTTAEAAYRRLGASWWLRRVTAGTAARRSVEVLHLHPSEGGVWTVGRHGGTGAVPDTKGLHYLRILLARPGADVPALDLSDAVAGHPGTQLHDGDLGPALDAQALAAYRRRLGELDSDLAEAREWADPARLERLEEERSSLIDELTRATGLAGRARRSGDSRERARVAVRKAIAAATGRLGDADPALARLLRDTVTTGGVCRYDPDPGRPVRWILDAPTS
ncbi:MAG: hypothetical protein ACXVX0_19390 [Blastococcus sp.]